MATDSQIRLFQVFVVFVSVCTIAELLILEYDDPASKAYNELHVDYREILQALIWVNIRRPVGSGSRFFLSKHERSCKNRCDDRRNAADYCHCDKLCALFQDCCIDYWPSCNVKTKPFNQAAQANWECVDTKIIQAKGNRSLPPTAYMMINRCPATYTKSNESSLRHCPRLHDDCTNPSEQIPVAGEDGNTYRSEYFARCHGMRNVSYWGLMVACLDPVENGTNLQYGSSYLRENCSWYLHPGNNMGSAKPCTRSTLCESLVNTSDSVKYKDIPNKCRAYSQTLYVGNFVYKNFHCALCNGKSMIDFQEPVANIKKPTLSIFFDYKTLSRSRYHRSNMTATEESSDDVIQSYLTLIGLSLSIACLLAVVVTYFRFKTLRTVPGLVLLGLSFSLLAYQSLLLASVYVPTGTLGCKAMAISLHFTITLSFAWMTVMSYDVTKTFTRKGKKKKRKPSFRRYVLIAIFVSVGIVGLTVILDETGSVDVGYGESSTCWIGEEVALILFFYVPVGIMLLFNVFSLIWTMMSIRDVTKLTRTLQRSVNSDQRGQNTKIYTKLSIVMGVTWILGFGAPHNTIVAYVYIIINSLQGVFIFATFVLNKRTTELWRNSASIRTRSTKLSKMSIKTKMAGPFASTNHLGNNNNEQHVREIGITNTIEKCTKN